MRAAGLKQSLACPLLYAYPPRMFKKADQLLSRLTLIPQRTFEQRLKASRASMTITDVWTIWRTIE